MYATTAEGYPPYLSIALTKYNIAGHRDFTQCTQQPWLYPVGHRHLIVGKYSSIVIKGHDLVRTHEQAVVSFVASKPRLVILASREKGSNGSLATTLPVKLCHKRCHISDSIHAHLTSNGIIMDVLSMVTWTDVTSSYLKQLTSVSCKLWGKFHLIPSLV